VAVRPKDSRVLDSPPSASAPGGEDDDTGWLERKVEALESQVRALRAQRPTSNRSSPLRVKPWYNNPRLTPLPAVTPHSDSPLDGLIRWGGDTPIHGNRFGA